LIKKIALYLFLCVVTQVYSQDGLEDQATENLEETERYLKLVQKSYKEGNYKLHKIYSDSLYFISKKNNLTAFQIKAMVNQAINLNMQAAYVEAITLYRKALIIAEKIPNDKHTQTLVLVNLGNTYNNVELYEKSIETMKKVLKNAEDTKTPDLMRMGALNGLSISYSALGNEKESLVYANQVKRIAEKKGNESIILTSLNHISNSHYKLGAYQKAIETASEANNYKYFKKNTRVKAWLLVNIGVANLKLKSYNEAEKHLNQALSIAAEKNIEEIIMVCYENLTKVYQELDKKVAFINAEKKYNEIRIAVLNNQKKAITDELKEEIKAKEKAILDQKETANFLSEQQKTILWFSAFCVFGLGGLFWIYIKRNDQKNTIKKTKREVDGINVITEKYKNSSLSPEDRISFKQKIAKVIEEEKVYLNHDLTQASFAQKLALSSHHLSEVLSFEFDTNFYQLINSYRIEEAKRLLGLPTNKNYKILAVAYDSGFKSKTTFNRVFKEQTGYTPTEYREKMNKSGSTL